MPLFRRRKAEPTEQEIAKWKDMAAKRRALFVVVHQAVYPDNKVPPSEYYSDYLITTELQELLSSILNYGK